MAALGTAAFHLCLLPAPQQLSSVEKLGAFLSIKTVKLNNHGQGREVLVTSQVHLAQIADTIRVGLKIFYKAVPQEP